MLDTAEPLVPRPNAGEAAKWWLYYHLIEPCRRKRRWHDQTEVLSAGKFFNVLHRALKRDRSLYRLGFVEKANGKKRPILVPDRPLLTVQKMIVRLLKAEYCRPPQVHGFSGGSVMEALQPHAARRQPIFCADVRHAFPNTNANAIFGYWRRREYGYYASYFLTALTTWPTPGVPGTISLPQGAPTSPWLFDICFTPFDRQLQKLAENMGGCYTRYADNLFFGAPRFDRNNPSARFKEGRDRSFFADELIKNDGAEVTPGLPLRRNEAGGIIFASPLVSAIYRIVQKGYGLQETLDPRHYEQLGGTTSAASIAEGLQRYRLGFQLHKSYLWSPDSGHDFLGLGLRIREGQVHNSRKFKNDLRYMVKRLTWLLNHKRPFEEEVWPAYRRLEGLMNFAVRETLSPELTKKTEDMLSTVFALRYSGPSGTFKKEVTY